MAILSCTPDNTESCKAFDQILLSVNLSLNQTLLTFALCKTNLDDSVDSASFFVRDYLPLIRNDSSTDMHGLPVM